MRHAMRFVALPILLLALPATADIVPARPVHPNVHVRLRAVGLVTSDAPRSDAAAVVEGVRAALAGQQYRIDRCLVGIDLREDPLRSRPRTLVGILEFDRSPRPTIEIVSARGVHRDVRTCIRGAARVIAIPQTPRGRVRVRFRYRIR